MVHKLTFKKINEFIKDEEKAIKEYQKLGLYELAKDEMEHLQYLKQLKRWVKK